MQQLNYFGLAALALELRPWIGSIWVRSFSQSKDEWVGTLRHERRILHIRISCRATLPYIAPEPKFRRARANSVNLFPDLIGKTIEDIYLLELDRVLVFQLSEAWALVCKMYGNRSNLLLVHANRVIDIFRHSLKDDLYWQIDRPLVRPPVITPAWHGKAPEPQSESFETQLREQIPVLDSLLCQAVAQLMQSGSGIDAALAQVAHKAQNPPFWVAEVKAQIQLHLLQPPTDAKATAYETFGEAVRQFARRSLSRNNYEQHRRHIELLLHRLGRSLRLKAQSLAQSLRKHERRRSDEEIGHLLMANLHNIPPHSKAIEVYDFYRDQPLTIPLDPQLSPQENAARYYRKQREREAKYHHQLAQLAELNRLLEQFEAIETAWSAVIDHESLRQFDRQHRSFLQGEPVQEAAQLPFREFECQGYQIWVGRNARSNDLLTFRFARKSDWWFHAKDVSGSHVVLRRKNAQNPPLAVIEYAAGLAAWFSKSRNETLVPVSMTERRYLRKNRRMTPGEVALEREEVILIEPTAPIS